MATGSWELPLGLGGILKQSEFPFRGVVAVFSEELTKSVHVILESPYNGVDDISFT